MANDREKYLSLLSQKYPSIQSVCTEIINLNAILNLPKGTEHFMSDIHGEYEAFCHILNNCSGVIREKVRKIFGQRLSDAECQEICTLIYYPKEKLEQLKAGGRISHEWYEETLNDLIEIAKLLSSKYTRSKVRKAMPRDFAYIIDELLHVMQDEDDNQLVYHGRILQTIIDIDNADAFIVALASLIKRLAVDHLHIVGDIFDRGPSADRILDMLMEYPSLDVQWGNHDILWMGAAAGSEACQAAVVQINLRHHNEEILESGYGISLRRLALFAEKTYRATEPMEAAQRAIAVILFKLEGQIISRRPDYRMQDRLLLDKLDCENRSIVIADRTYPLESTDFPTVSRQSPYTLTPGEEEIVRDMKNAFRNSERLQRHISFLYRYGGMYRIFNGNLLYHGCIPLDEEGNFEGVVQNGKTYQGRAYLDYADKIARRAYFGDKRQSDLDFMWYLWCGRLSPLSGRNVKTFERCFIADQTAWKEEKNPYYRYYFSQKTCNMILREFGLYSSLSHIINGHNPVRAGSGEDPIRAGGKLIVIDGGFCKDYHKTTGIAGYTLIYNSHGMRIKSHQPFESIREVLLENKDIESSSTTFETEAHRVMVENTDSGREILQDVADLKLLLQAYRDGEIKERPVRDD